jgi:hypothetical protein
MGGGGAGAGVEEASAVEMAGTGSLVIDAVEEGRDQRGREAQADGEEEEQGAEAAEPGSHSPLPRACWHPNETGLGV